MESYFDLSDFRMNRDKYRLFRTAITNREIGDIPTNTTVSIEYIRESLNIQTLQVEPMYRIFGSSLPFATVSVLAFGSQLSNFVL